MKNLILVSVALFLSACASDKIIVQTKYIRETIPEEMMVCPPLPPMITEPITEKKILRNYSTLAKNNKICLNSMESIREYLKSRSTDK